VLRIQDFAPDSGVLLLIHEFFSPDTRVFSPDTGVFRFLVEKAEQMKLASIIAAEGDTEAAELLATAFGKAGEGLVRYSPR